MIAYIPQYAPARPKTICSGLLSFDEKMFLPFFIRSRSSPASIPTPNTIVCCIMSINTAGIKKDANPL